MSENRDDSPFFGPRQPAGGSADAAPADREAYARAVREAGYPPIRGGAAPPEQPAGPGFAPAADVAPPQAGSVPPLGAPGFAPAAGVDLGQQHDSSGFAPAAGFGPLDQQIYVQAGAPAPPPDYLRRAPAGRRAVLWTLVPLLLVDLGILVLYVTRFGANAGVNQQIRLVIGVVLSIMVYKGSFTAYWILLFGLVVGAIDGLGVGVPLMDEGLVGLTVIGQSVMYAVVAAVLAFAPGVRDFLESQRLCDYPGAGGSM